MHAPGLVRLAGVLPVTRDACVPGRSGTTAEARAARSASRPTAASRPAWRRSRTARDRQAAEERRDSGDADERGGGRPSGAPDGARAWDDERERRRPLEARGGQSGRDILDPTREHAAGAAAAEVVVEQRRLELGELAVDPQRSPPAGALAQERNQFHTEWDASPPHAVSHGLRSTRSSNAYRRSRRARSARNRARRAAPRTRATPAARRVTPSAPNAAARRRSSLRPAAGPARGCRRRSR